MALQPQLPDDSIPPIILLVEDDPDARDMYSMFLESSGMWVATASDPAAAADAVHELKPDLIVTDLGFESEARALEFAHAIKEDEATAHVPLVLLSGRPPKEIAREDRAAADLLLLKPVLPDDLAGHIASLLKHSRELRARTETARARVPGLLKRSNELIARAQSIEARVKQTERRCPTCAQPLQFVETGRIDGAEYDYYHWCERGCGLHCYDRAAQRWVKLAG